MKLLLDENLSHRLVNIIEANFPGSAHERSHSRGAVWLGIRVPSHLHGFPLLVKQ